MRVPCLLPWISVHVDAHGRILPCAPETARASYGQLSTGGASAAWTSADAETARHQMASAQWHRTCRRSCEVLQHPPIDLLLATPPEAHPGLGGAALDAPAWQALRQAVLADPDRGLPAPLLLTVEEGEVALDRADVSFARVQRLKLVLSETRPFGPSLQALVKRVLAEARPRPAIEIECPLQGFDGEVSERCRGIEPRALTLFLRGVRAATIDACEGRGSGARVRANLGRLRTLAATTPLTLVLELTRRAIDEVPELFALARSLGARARLRRPRALLGREDPFATRSYRDLVRLKTVLDRAAEADRDVWDEADRARWESEPLIASLVRRERAAYVMVATAASDASVDAQLALAGRRGA